MDIDFGPLTAFGQQYFAATDPNRQIALQDAAARRKLLKEQAQREATGFEQNTFDRDRQNSANSILGYQLRGQPSVGQLGNSLADYVGRQGVGDIGDLTRTLRAAGTLNDRDINTADLTKLGFADDTDFGVTAIGELERLAASKDQAFGVAEIYAGAQERASGLVTERTAEADRRRQVLEILKQITANDGAAGGGGGGGAGGGRASVSAPSLPTGTPGLPDVATPAGAIGSSLSALQVPELRPSVNFEPLPRGRKGKDGEADVLGVEEELRQRIDAQFEGARFRGGDRQRKKEVRDLTIDASKHYQQFGRITDAVNFAMTQANSRGLVPAPQQGFWEGVSAVLGGETLTGPNFTRQPFTTIRPNADSPNPVQLRGETQGHSVAATIDGLVNQPGFAAKTLKAEFDANQKLEQTRHDALLEAQAREAKAAAARQGQQEVAAAALKARHAERRKFQFAALRALDPELHDKIMQDIGGGGVATSVLPSGELTNAASVLGGPQAGGGVGIPPIVQNSPGAFVPPPTPQVPGPGEVRLEELFDQLANERALQGQLAQQNIARGHQQYGTTRQLSDVDRTLSSVDRAIQAETAGGLANAVPQPTAELNGLSDLTTLLRGLDSARDRNAIDASRHNQLRNELIRQYRDRGRTGSRVPLGAGG